MKLSELIKQSHELAVEKGWWESLDVDEKLLMIHSEISEAVECYRNGEMGLTYDKCPISDILCGKRVPTCVHTFWIRDAVPATAHTKTTHRKPLGFPSEIADVAIRCADLLGHLGEPAWHAELPRRHYTPPTIITALMTLHRLAVKGDAANTLEVCIDHCYAIARLVGFELDDAIRIKHEYNRTRSHRHGGKRI